MGKKIVHIDSRGKWYVDEFGRWRLDSKETSVLTSQKEIDPLLKKLEDIYDRVDNSQDKLNEITELLKIYLKDFEYDVNEIKTVLIISKGFTYSDEEILKLYNELNTKLEKLLIK